MTTAASKNLRGSKPFKLPAITLVDGEDGNAPTVPDWVMLFPAGLTHTNDGRYYRNQDPKGAIARTEQVGLFLPADIDHGMEYGSPEPSMGWVEEYAVRDGAIWGRVDWTDLGRDKITAKHYRYISPAFDHDEDFNLLNFRSIGLVNQPAFTMPALARAQKPAKATAAQTPSETETIMDEETLAKFRKIFNLAEDADEVAVQAAIDAAAEAVDSDDEDNDDADLDASVQEGLPAGDDNADLEGALPENPDPESFVHRADYDAVVSRLAERDAEHADAPSEVEVSEAVQAAVASGRIAPATQGHHTAMCSTRKGLASFKAMVKASPKIVSTQKAATATASLERGQKGLSPNQLATCKRMGLEPKAYAATLKNIQQKGA